LKITALSKLEVTDAADFPRKSNCLASYKQVRLIRSVTECQARSFDYRRFTDSEATSFQYCSVFVRSALILAASGQPVGIANVLCLARPLAHRLKKPPTLLQKTAIAPERFLFFVGGFLIAIGLMTGGSFVYASFSDYRCYLLINITVCGY